MPRRDPGTPTRPQAIRPAARPVDTFVRPTPAPNFLGATPIGPDSGAQLAQSLSRFAPKLARFAKDRNDRQSKADLEAGKIAALTTALNSKEAIEKGLISPTASPFFMQGFNEQRGRVAGVTAKIGLNDAYRQFEGKNDNDPAVFQKFLTTFRTQTIEQAGGDSAFLQGLLPGIREAEQQLIGKHIAFTEKRVLDEVKANTSTEFGQAVADAQVADGDLDLDTLALELNLIAARQGFLGISKTALNDLQVQSVIAAALEGDGDPDVLDVLNLPRPDGTPGPGKTAANSKLISTARQQLRNREIREDNQYYKTQDRVEEEATDAIYTSLIQEIIANPLADVDLTRQDVKLGTKLDRDFQADLLSFQSALRANIREEDPNDVANLFGSIYSTLSPLTMRDLVNSVSTGSRFTPKTIELAARAVARERENTVLKDPMLRAMIPRLDKSIIGSEANLTTTNAATASNAFVTLVTTYSDFLDRNPDASDIDKLTEIQRINTLLIKKNNFEEQAIEPTQ